MGTTFKTFFATATQLLEAMRKLISALDHLCSWADETAGSFADNSRRERLQAQANAETTILLEQKN